ncbi:MAG TPA: hypothetical protein VK669_01345 [Candidatus Limnocylindrales bacterium]|nr:hypothetical protein [Candidatus Limnocylindrales bacterium]
MRTRVVSLLGIAVLALPVAAGAAEPQAPPTLTPIVAHDVGDACPGTARYAEALVRGIGRADAVAARPLFAACAAKTRLPGFLWKTDAANVALGAVDLSLGVLDRDAAAMRRAAGETSDLRSRSVSTDEQVRGWTIIPDYAFRNETRTFAYLPATPANAQLARRPFTDDFAAENAAYINVAARTGTAWITTPRVTTGISYSGIHYPNDAVRSPARASTQKENAGPGNGQ